MNIFHIVKVYFSRRAAHIDQEWLNKRFEFFNRHTNQSLQRQSFNPFYFWIHCEPGMDDMMGRLAKMLPPVTTIYTFGDHYADKVQAKAMPELQNSDYVYVTRIDSDDLYASTALEHVHNCKPMKEGRIEASFFKTGYMYDLTYTTTGQFNPYGDMHEYGNGRLGVYSNPSSPFHTLMIPTSIFLNTEEYNKQFIGDHSQVKGAYPHQYLPDWQFTVLIHGNNWLSTFDYSRAKDVAVPKYWNEQRFIEQPVVFDVDDFCDGNNCLPEVYQLKERYSRFRCTLFTIPNHTSKALIHEVKQHEWIELGVHGVNHIPLDEMLHYTKEEIIKHLNDIDKNYYSPIFRPPGWFMNEDVLEACNEAGFAIAPHARDLDKTQRMKHGYYICGERQPYWHGHTHDVCGNWLKGHLNELIDKWPRNQAFATVGESINHY